MGTQFSDPRGTDFTGPDFLLASPAGAADGAFRGLGGDPAGGV